MSHTFSTHRTVVSMLVTIALTAMRLTGLITQRLPDTQGTTKMQDKDFNDESEVRELYMKIGEIIEGHSMHAVMYSLCLSLTACVLEVQDEEEIDIELFHEEIRRMVERGFDELVTKQ
jgi:hypothetical protein